MRKIIISILFIYSFLYAQNLNIPIERNTSELDRLSQIWQERFLQRNNEAKEIATRLNLPIRKEMSDGTLVELQYFDERGFPHYYKTDNADAAESISTDEVYSGGAAGTSLNGAGITVREWDGGAVLTTHQEYGGRVTQVDSPSSTHYHATHVAGTIMASGVQPAAKGMAYAAMLRAFDWNGDQAEMASEASGGALLSNHSYGWVVGWAWGDWANPGTSEWHWMGDPAISPVEDYNFGFYNSQTQAWDQISRNAPYYLIVKSAGNDRNDNGPGAGGAHKVWVGSSWISSTTTRDPDGQYDCLGPKSCAKNILTVAAVNDVPGGYSTPGNVTMTSFSSWGPADDGRIKPDISANGYNLYSTFDGNNSDYSSISGTSMSSPSVTGSLALIQEHYSEQTRAYLKAATLKGLVLHTADEAGSNPGPDYEFGWGLMNTQKAVEMINNNGATALIEEHSLANGGSFSLDITALGTQPLEVTICWTDPAGTPVADAVDPANPMLVNDLDLRVTKTGFTGYPWKLNRLSPASAATQNSDNAIDNVEKVYVGSPTASSYTITVTHKGSLSSSQNFSIIVSGASFNPPSISLTPTSITANLLPDVTQTDDFRITNSGGGDLYYNSFVEFVTREVNSSRHDVNEIPVGVELLSNELSNDFINSISIEERDLDEWNGYVSSPTIYDANGNERATLYDPSDFGLSYPFTISKVRHYFYENSSYPWDESTYKIRIYASDGVTVLYESGLLTALHDPASTEHILSTPVVITSGNFYLSYDTTGGSINSGYPGILGNNTVSISNSYFKVSGLWYVLFYGVGNGYGELYQEFYAEEAESWLSITSNESGVVSGSRAFVDVGLLFDSSGLTNGTTKTANINITSNDPANLSILLPVTMNVQTAVAPEVPINLLITYSGGNVTVSWSAVSGAIDYNIYSDTDPEGSFSSAEATGNISTSWTGAASITKKFFKVTANN